MQLSLNLPERVGAIAILADIHNGPREFLHLVKAARKAVEFEQPEYEEYGMNVRQDGGLAWDEQKAKKAKDFIFADGVYKYLKDHLKTLDETGKLHMDLLALADKILLDTPKKGKGKPKA